VKKKMFFVHSLAAMLASTTPAFAQDPISLQAYSALSRPAPTAEISYGSAATQAIDVFIPAGSGPFPVVVLIHGGCWRALPNAAREQMRHLGVDLAKQGMAVWSIGYRRADEAGGGYPGTYQDVGLAIDRLRAEAPRYRLDITRTVLVGHSAGGHMALWAAGRDRLPATSALYVDKPFVPRQVVSLAGIGDLKTFAPTIPLICGPGTAESLTGKATPQRPDIYADTSPVALGTKGVGIVMLSGVLDRLVPPYVAHDYALLRRDELAVTLVNVPDAGHFDLVTTGRPAWDEARKHIEAALISQPSVLIAKSKPAPIELKFE
jgi:acetyl esterase/lipase